MEKLVSSIEIVVKLKRYRDAVYNLFTAGSGSEIEYIERMKIFQAVLKAQISAGHSELEAITDTVEKEEDARLQVQILAAGYELLSGNDYTKL